MASYNKFTHSIDTVDESIERGVREGVLHQVASGGDGRSIQIDQHRLINFSSCSYLGLESDPRLRRGCIDALERYGTQFTPTRAHVSTPLNAELEALFADMFGAPTLVLPSAAVAHQTVIPVLVREEDAVMLDLFVHNSVQVAARQMIPRGVPIELIRHNDLATLERNIQVLRQKHRRVWYMVDGVYSMHGDFAPLQELEQLMNRYPQFSLYVDDAHGMSWAGRNGAGWAMSQMRLHPQMILTSSLNKGFAGMGGIAVFPEAEQYRKVRNCGGPLTFSTPIPPPMLGASVASAKIHLSPEIEVLQRELRSRVEHCQRLAERHGLPVVARSSSPIFFIGAGLPRMCFNLAKRLFNEGFYVPPCVFPAVSAQRYGLRICLTTRQSLDDIERLMSTLAYHYPRALTEERITHESICRTFNLPHTRLAPTAKDDGLEERPAVAPPLDGRALSVQHETTASRLDAGEWNSLLGNRGSFDVAGLLFLEETFRGNSRAENNWEFHYLIIRDGGVPVAATFFTVALCKDDIFAHASVSRELEQYRAAEPYFMCSRTLMMGSQLTEGHHLYLDRKSPRWKDALRVLVERARELGAQTRAETLTLRDFDASDVELRDCLLADGFMRVDLPDSNILSSDRLGWSDMQGYLARLSKKSRRHLRGEVLRKEGYYDVEILNHASGVDEALLERWYELYRNVKARSFEVNTFDLPRKCFANMVAHPQWEVVNITLKPEYAPGSPPLVVAIAFCYTVATASGPMYVPMIPGLDYEYVRSHGNYRQLLFQLVKRANSLGARRIYFGFTAPEEKHKFGAEAVARVAYVQTTSRYNTSVIDFATIRAVDKRLL